MIDDYEGENIDHLPNGGVVIRGILDPEVYKPKHRYEWDYAGGHPIGIGAGPRPPGGGCYAECWPCGLMAGHNTGDPAQLSWTMDVAQAWADEHNAVEHPFLTVEYEVGD